MEDLDAIEAVEAACFPPAEAASNESLTARVAAYPDHFWLLVNTDDDDTPFPSRVEDGTLVGFVDGMATNEPNLADAMYDDADMHDEHGDWQMIFGVNRVIAYVSQFVTLKIGDLIYTGTPVGVGPVRPGDRIRASLEGRLLLDFDIK